jgi:2-keto-3-deoxy-L-rhamnonate aldolase RhmA
MYHDGLLVNRPRRQLASGGYAIGVIHAFVDRPAVMRMIGAAGFDFVMIDLSHTSFSIQAVGALCDMARASGVVPIVRPYDRSPEVANRLQDVGAMGFMYPHMETRADIDEILTTIKYPPVGHRGATGRGGPSTDYRTSGEMSGPELKDFVNENTLLAIQIESKEAVDAIDALLQGGGVDVAEIGRNDLSTSYGHPYEIRHPVVLDAVDRVIDACKRHGVTPGAGCYGDDDARDMVARGMRYLTYSNDRNILNDAYTRGNKLLRDLIAEHADVLAEAR